MFAASLVLYIINIPGLRDEHRSNRISWENVGVIISWWAITCTWREWGVNDRYLYTCARFVAVQSRTNKICYSSADRSHFLAGYIRDRFWILFRPIFDRKNWKIPLVHSFLFFLSWIKVKKKKKKRGRFSHGRDRSSIGNFRAIFFSKDRGRIGWNVWKKRGAIWDRTRVPWPIIRSFSRVVRLVKKTKWRIEPIERNEGWRGVGGFWRRN